MTALPILLVLALVAALLEAGNVGIGRALRLRQLRAEHRRLALELARSRHETQMANDSIAMAERELHSIRCTRATVAGQPAGAMVLNDLTRRSRGVQPYSGESTMTTNFARLAAAFQIDTDDGDEQAVIEKAIAVDAQRRLELSCTIQERDIAIGLLERAKIEIAAAKIDEDARLAVVVADAKLELQIDYTIAGAYRTGILIHARDDDGEVIPSQREARLRRLAQRDGIAALIAELAESPQLVPVNRRVVNHEEHKARRSSGTREIESAAKQLNIDPETLVEYVDSLGDKP